MNRFHLLKGAGFRALLISSIAAALSLHSFTSFAEEVVPALPVAVEGASAEGGINQEQPQGLDAEGAQDAQDEEATVVVEGSTDSDASAETSTTAPQFYDLQALRDFDHDLVDFTPAPTRSYKQSFKDEVLSFCISSAYQHLEEVKEDALYTAAAFHSWSRYEYDEVMDKISPLVSEYLAKPYRHEQETDEEIEELEVAPQSQPQPKLSLLKCLDLYHSPELEQLAQEYVIDPERSYDEDHSHIP